MSPYKWLYGYIKKHIASLVFTVIITLVFVGMTFVQPLTLGNLIEAVTAGKSLSNLWIYALILIGAIVVKMLVWYLRQHIFESISQDVILNIRKNIFKKLQANEVEYFEHNRTGDIMAALSLDTEYIRVFVASTIPVALTQIALIIIGLTILLSVSPLLALCLLIVTPFIGIFSVKYVSSITPLYRQMRNASAELNTVAEENISGNRVVKAYAREDHENKKFDKANKGYYTAVRTYAKTWADLYPNMQFFIECENVVFVLASGILLITGKMTFGEFTTINGILWCITSPLSSLGNLLSQIKQFVTGSAKLLSIEEYSPKISNTHKILKKGTGINGKVEFRNVQFNHGKSRAIRGISFTAEPGMTVGITGPTGSGKTSIVNLIARFHEATEGTVYIDDINVKNIDLETLRKSISYAMQDIFLFSDTIKDNIAYGVPDATDADIERVAKIANAHDFIMAMPDGYNTIVGERGVGLSGGQRQRISLARALLKNPSILILDDTTSAIDMETEHMIQNMLKKSFANKTTFIIAHRISSIKNADLILVMKDGRIIEWGTHDELIKQNGYYKTACDDQYGDFNNMAGGENNG